MFHDEELFASREVVCVGYPIGLIVAETQQQALGPSHRLSPVSVCVFASASIYVSSSAELQTDATRKVVVTYEDLPNIITIEEAIEKESFFPVVHKLSRGNVEKGFAKSQHVIEGEMKVGGQEHFYLEPQVRAGSFRGISWKYQQLLTTILRYLSRYQERRTRWSYGPPRRIPRTRRTW